MVPKGFILYLFLRADNFNKNRFRIDKSIVLYFVVEFKMKSFFFFF